MTHFFGDTGRKSSISARATFGTSRAGTATRSKASVPQPLPDNPKPGSLNEGALTHRYRLLAQAPTAFPGGTMRIA
jgi:hypothetical protein